MKIPRKSKPSHANGAHNRKPSALKRLRAFNWLPNLWWYKDRVALAFETEPDLDAAIELCWNDKDLKGVPRVHVGDWTMIVPAESLPFFQKKAANFTVKEVISAGDLSPEQMAKVRRGESLD